MSIWQGVYVNKSRCTSHCALRKAAVSNLYLYTHSKSPFTPLIPKLNLMKILSCGNSPNTSELSAPGSLKEFATWSEE